MKFRNKLFLFLFTLGLLLGQCLLLRCLLLFFALALRDLFKIFLAPYINKIFWFGGITLLRRDVILSNLTWRLYFPYLEAVVQRCSVKKVLLEISQNSQETPVPESLC